MSVVTRQFQMVYLLLERGRMTAAEAPGGPDPLGGGGGGQ